MPNSSYFLLKRFYNFLSKFSPSLSTIFLVYFTTICIFFSMAINMSLVTDGVSMFVIEFRCVQLLSFLNRFKPYVCCCKFFTFYERYWIYCSMMSYCGFEEEFLDGAVARLSLEGGYSSSKIMTLKLPFSIVRG